MFAMSTRYILTVVLLVCLIGCGRFVPEPKGKRSNDPKESDAVVADSVVESEDSGTGNEKGDQPTDGKDQKDEKPATPTEINLENASLVAFEQSAYPILQANCVRCHGGSVSPFIAAADVKTAFGAVTTNNKVDLDSPEDSRLVVRLNKDNHQCWTNDCDADADEMLAAIRSWADAIADLDAESENGIETELRSFVDGSKKEANVDPGTIVRLANDYQAIDAPMTVANDDVDGEATEYLVVPAGNGGLIAPDGVGGTVTYTFEVTKPGTYALYGRIKSPSGNSNSFHWSLDGGPFLAWGTAVSVDQWVWDRANSGNGMTQESFDLTVGTHTIVIKQREELTRINRIAVTDQLAGFQGAEIVGEVFEMAFDLEPLTGKKASLIVEADIWDEATNTYKLSNPRIETEEVIEVKDLMPLVNGKFNPQHSTFRLVDQVVQPPGASLSSASMIVIGEDGWDLDTLGFTFGELK